MSPRSRRNAVSYFNVMVVGFAGVGKTSFIKTLLEALKNDEVSKDQLRRTSVSSQPTLPHDANNRSQIEGPLKKTEAPYTISVNLDVDGEKVMLTLIDTPGFHGDFLIDKQLHDILGYIEHQFDLTLAEESKVKRNPKAVDTQVHACLYVVDPSKRALDDYDIRILTRLSQRVNVIPIIGKADTLTHAQRTRLKPSIMQDIYGKYKIPLYGMPEEEDDDDEGDVEEDGEQQQKKQQNNNGSTNGQGSLSDFLQQFNYDEEDEETQAFIDYLRLVPFTVIAYEDDPDTGKPIEIEGIKIGRDYGWGKIDCLSDEYSDFNRLKTVLLSTHRRILQTETIERYYEQYRTERLLIRRATKLKSMDLSKKILEDLNQI